MTDELVTVVRNVIDQTRYVWVMRGDGHYYYNASDYSIARIERWATYKRTNRYFDNHVIENVYTR